MSSEDAIEIVRASLALAFPTASAEGISRAAETVIRWGSEGVAEHLNDSLTTRMLLDLAQVSGVSLEETGSAEPDWLSSLRIEMAAQYRTWSRTEGMDLFPFLPRPPDEPTTPGRRPNPPPIPGAS